jgi:putative membrane protein insertion efficiency factor
MGTPKRGFWWRAGAPLRLLAVLLLRLYRYTLSAFVGRGCRHLPTCSEFMEQAIRQHGFWPGGWVGTARLCRCHPYGTSGYDPVPPALPPAARWWRPWRYGDWRWRRPEGFSCEAVAEPQSPAKQVPGKR